MATAQPCFSYDVFLSFRGEDTRKTFTDHLYTAMKQAGIRTFQDDDSMERGKLLEPEIKKAIHESAISLIVFSKTFASSKWCLDEVLAIIEEHETSSSKHEVVPVFYGVDPSDVRNQIGIFQEAFDAYDDIIKAETNLEKKREWLEKLGAWRDSLRKAATFTGMVFTDGYEAKFITNIVNVIRKKMDYKALYIEDKLVGIKDDVAEIESWLQDTSPNAVILVIAGMGGIGKTTIAKCIYNSNFHKYDGSCFLADIDKETSNKTSGLRLLQSQLLSTILKSEKEETIWNVHEGTNKVTNAISNKKVLLVLDDVTTSEQLDGLLGGQRFYPGSKVIITTRHKWLLTSFKPHPKLVSKRKLSTCDSTELFSLYAFDQDQPIEPYIAHTELFVRYCRGHPLALKILASSLYGNTYDVWEDTMRKLEAGPNPKIQKVLQISYETLEDDNDKDLFLHVACFFDGKEKDYIVKLLVECDLFPVVGIKNLMDRCLLYVEDGRVMMHQLIKEMGREVVRQESPKNPGKRSRLWHHHDCFTVLQDNSGTRKVEGLMLDMEKIKEGQSASTLKMNNPVKGRSEEYLGPTLMHGNDVTFKICALEKMKNLTLLQLNHVTFFGKSKMLPKKLRLLSWHGFSLKVIPSDVCLEKLVVLDMSYSKLKCVWDDFKFIRSLKILNLSYSVELAKTPDFRGLPNLESLILKGCLSLIKVDESIAHLHKLVLLDLTYCRSLREFPSLPRSLSSLEMSGCPNLGVVARVQCFYPISSFSLLENVNFSYCNLSDKSFPNDWSSLVSLVYLNLDGNNVTFVPKCIKTLPRIQTLSVEYCSKLQSVQGVPSFIKSLYIGENESLEKLQFAKNSKTVVFQHTCPKLCHIEGRYKLQSINNVEKKIIEYLGLESNAHERMELDLKVLHEFGIFSTFVYENQIPSSFMYRERGPQISFTVPWHPDNSNISGFNMCVMLSQLSVYPHLEIEVYNKTKDMLWKYIKEIQETFKNMEKFAWLSLWRCGNLLAGGDEIVIRIMDREVDECRLNLLYEEDEQEQVDGEKMEKQVNAVDQISWTDRMDKDISDYIYRGKKHLFHTGIERQTFNY